MKRTGLARALAQVTIRLLVLFLSAFSVAAFAAEAEPTTEAAKAINAFAVAHHRLLPSGNTLASPLSIETCLAMTYAGADGHTRDALRKAFFFPADDKVLHGSFQSIQQSFLAKPEADGTLRFANRIFYEKEMALLPDWSNLTRTFYSAEPGPIDFRTNFRSAEKEINQWVSDKTNQKIPAIIPPSTLDARTRMVLVNAVYFDVPWDERFTKELTQDRPFRLSASQFKTVPLMFKQHKLGYAKKDGFQITALPYAGGTFQFVVILPDAVDGLARVEHALTGELLSECAKLTPTEVRLSFPRLRMEPPIVSLKRTLTTLGAGVMFDSKAADFSRIADAKKDPLYVKDVFHRTYLELDEDGTKAAAATAAVMLYRNGHPREVQHQVVKADHPFLFMIQHVPSGACVFLGRLTDPTPNVRAIAGEPTEGPTCKK